jgi:hypothetical protein
MSDKFKVEIGLDNSFTFSSVEMSRSELQAELDAADGKVGTGSWNNLKIKTVDEMLGIMADTALGRKTADGMVPNQFSMETYDGKLSVDPKKVSYFMVVDVGD